MENTRTVAGNILVAVPEGYTVRTGDNMGDADDNQVWLQTNPPGFTDYYWIILQKSEESVDNSISMTRSINGGEYITPFALGETQWSGVTYFYGDLVCNVLKGKSAKACFQVTVIGHEIMSPEVQSVLASIEEK